MDNITIQKELLYIFNEKKRIQDEKNRLNYELERLEIARNRQLIQEEMARLVQQKQNLADYEEESEQEESEEELNKKKEVTKQNLVDKSIENNNNKIDLLHKIGKYYSRKGLYLPFGIRMYTLEQLQTHWKLHCFA